MRIGMVNGAIAMIIMNWGPETSTSVPYGTSKSVWGNPTPEDEHFIVVSPEKCSVDEINYISGFVIDVEKALMDPDGINSETGLGYQDYIDLDSFADKYLVEETVKNYDGGVSSAFYFKDSDLTDSDLIDGRICAGPGWDYDMSLGNYLEWMQDLIGDESGFTKLALSEGSSVWFAELIKKPEFMEKVRSDYMEKVRPYLLELEGGVINDYDSLLSSSAAMDSIRWQKMYSEQGITMGNSENYSELISFISLRREFLDGEWLD